MGESERWGRRGKQQGSRHQIFRGRSIKISEGVG